MMARIGWSQPLCEACYAAWQVGRGDVPREPCRGIGQDDEPCLICATPTTIYTRIDPRIAEHFKYAKPRDD